MGIMVLGRPRRTGRCCPICGYACARFLDWSPAYRNVECPRCHSHPRQRSLYLYLTRRTAFFRSPMSVLDIGPSRSLSAVFRHLGHLKYVTADLHQACDLKFDIHRIPLPNHCFDAILCSHVLEHVRDDRKALQELHRILKPHGWAYLQVPIDHNRSVTLQDPAINTPELRLKHYWDRDHVRLYGRDYLGRLQAAGFTVDVIDVLTFVQRAEAEHFGLDTAESLYFAKREPPRRRAPRW